MRAWAPSLSVPSLITVMLPRSVELDGIPVYGVRNSTTRCLCLGYEHIPGLSDGIYSEGASLLLLDFGTLN